jgi:hypothetical protein
MSTAVAPFPSLFVRRTTLSKNEYRVNFKQIDNDVIKALVSAEARKVTPQISTIYLSLLAAPQHCWERDGVIHFVGEDRQEGHFTAWDQMREIAGVANSTLSKALDWMHKAGVIGYDARANGAGIRIFFNRALESIRSKPPEKILPFVPTPSAKAPTPTNGIGFKESSSETIREITLRAVAREKVSGIGHPAAAAGSSTAAIPTPIPQAAFKNPLADDIALIAKLTKQLAADLYPEITSAIRRQTDETKEWFLNHAVPKATRVAQRETYNLLRAHGVISKKNNSSVSVGRNIETSGKGREGKCDNNEIVSFLAETGAAMRQAAADAIAAGRSSLHDACLIAGRELGDLHDQVVANEQVVTNEIENRLIRIEDEIARAIWNATGASECEMLLAAAKLELQSYAMRMEREVFEDAVRRRVVTRLREQYGIPRVSLFYLT